MNRTKMKRTLVLLLTASLLTEPFAIHGSAKEITKSISVSENDTLSDNDGVSDNYPISGNDMVSENGVVSGNDSLSENGVVSGNDSLSENDMVSGNEAPQDSGGGSGNISDNETPPEFGNVSDNETPPEFGNVSDNETPPNSGSVSNNEMEDELSDAEKNNDHPRDHEGNIIPITDEVWIAGFERESETLVYTGGKVTQNLRIYHEGTLLKEKTDYTLTYKNNVQAASYNDSKAPSVTITLKGQYKGSQTLYFTIAPRDIDEDGTQGYEQIITYKKKMSLPVPDVYYGGKKLVLNKDFTCDYSDLPKEYQKGDSYEPGVVYEYRVNGCGNFKGSFVMRLSVVRSKNLNFENLKVTLDKKQYEYHGEPLTKTEVKVTSVKVGNKELDTKLYEYEVHAENTGSGYVLISPSEMGMENGYRGVKKVKIKVVADRTIKDAVVGEEFQKTMVFTKQSVKKNGGMLQKTTGVLFYPMGNELLPMTEGKDYVVSYSNHKKTGTATITFKGIGRYKGSVKKTYRIKPNTDVAIKWHMVDEVGEPTTSYKKGGAVPEFSLFEGDDTEEKYALNSKKDYTVTLRKNKAIGTMSCEIVGKGNYKGYHSVTEVKVLCADISQGSMILKDKPYSTKKDAWKSTVTIFDVNGKKLTAGTDYGKAVQYEYEGMENGQPPQPDTVVSVKVEGKNNYAGSYIIGNYRIYSIPISELIVKMDAQVYTGKDILLKPEDIHVYANKEDAKNGIEVEKNCYEVVGYSKNRKVGKASVTLRGLGKYGGTKNYSFQIKKKAYEVVQVTQVQLEVSELLLAAGNTKQLIAEVSPKDARNKTILWKSSNKKIATVDSDGRVTGLKPGKVTIKAVSQDTGVSASCKVEVENIPVTSFSLNTSQISQAEGTQYQLKAVKVMPAEANLKTIKWESTHPQAAEVDENGLVTLKRAGMAVIRAYVEETGIEKRCLVYVNGTKDEAPEGNYFTPQMFRGLDDKDDTKAFQRAIRDLSEECNTVYVPEGTYLIDAKTSIRLTSNMNFIMSPHAVLQAIGNEQEHYDVLYVRSVENVTISGGTIKGERYDHKGTTGEWGMGIGVYDSSNIQISDVKITDCWGDGIYLGSKHEDDSIAGCENITIRNCKLYNNRRNNLSIVCADEVNVDNCEFNDANGTAPEYGIDIEPNNIKNPCKKIVITNSTFTGNRQAAMGINNPADDVTLQGCTLNGTFINYSGTHVKLVSSTVNGKIHARIGVTLLENTIINAGSSKEDVLVASFDADKGPFTIGEYHLDEENPMSYEIVEDADSPNGKALQLKRLSEGTKECGYYLDLSELTVDGTAILEAGSTYRFEYEVKGKGTWGMKTDQTGWYPSVLTEDGYYTGFTTIEAKESKNCRILLYAVDKTKDMEWNIASIKIYKVR